MPDPTAVTAIHPLVLYLGCALGAAAVAVAMPRKGVSLHVIGGLIGAAAIGLLFLAMGLRAAPSGQLPGVSFYVFAAIALGAGLRMITHPRPVYAALYFVLTIVASCGLYLLLHAEFMALALIIIYAGAILITYLFVIMLATQAPDEEEEGRLSDYDASAREPIAAAGVGFVLIGVLTSMMFAGSQSLAPAEGSRSALEDLASLPVKVERELDDAGLLGGGEIVLRDDETGSAVIDAEGTIIVATADDGATRPIPFSQWPETLRVTNVERLGLNLLGDHPMTIEIAGVILLMAMLGAVVLARKQVDLEEEAKARQQRRLTLGDQPESPRLEMDGGAS